MSHSDAIIIGMWIFTGMCFHAPDVKVGFSLVSLAATAVFSAVTLLVS